MKNAFPQDSTGHKTNFSHGYYITAELRVKDEALIQITKDSLLLLSQETLKEPGCALFSVHQDTNMPTRFLLWECFYDKAAFENHFKAPHTINYLEKDLTEVVQYFQTDVLQEPSVPQKLP